jgi:outer membrane protein assembly factor BamA
MRLPLRFVFATLTLAVSIAHAQTYTPKQIRIDAPAGTDTAEPLRVAALEPGVPLSKQQIETALQRLADTGLFADISYTVNSDALVIKLTPSASSQAQPVHFANFVWWQPGELEPLLEARVPLYKGKLPVTGTLTEQVEAALVAMLKDKGIDAAVSARESGSSADSVTLSLTRPSVVVGTVTLQGDLPALQPQTLKLTNHLRNQDFDRAETGKTIADSVNDLYQNAGYLDVTTSMPAYSAPHKDLNDYAVDLLATVTPNAPYHVTQLTLHATSPVSESELQKAAEIHPGDTASPLALRIAHGELEKTYADHGFLDARATIDTSKDTTAHTVAYSVTFAPGTIYHFAALDTSALPPDQQSAIATSLRMTPGAIADQNLLTSIAHTLNDLHLLRSVNFLQKPDRATHTVTILLTPRVQPHK